MGNTLSITDFTELSLDQKRNTLREVFDGLKNHNEHTISLQKKLIDSPDSFDAELCHAIYAECGQIAAKNEEIVSQEGKKHLESCQRLLARITEQEEQERQASNPESLLDRL